MPHDKYAPSLLGTSYRAELYIKNPDFIDNNFTINLIDTFGYLCYNENNLK